MGFATKLSFDAELGAQPGAFTRNRATGCPRHFQVSLRCVLSHLGSLCAVRVSRVIVDRSMVLNAGVSCRCCITPSFQMLYLCRASSYGKHEEYAGESHAIMY